MKPKYPTTDHQPSTIKTPQPITDNYDIPPIPLENCLAKTNRALLNGVGKGSRNNSAIALAYDLIGTEKHLKDLRVSFTGNARELFELFASQCQPSLEPYRVESTWKSAESDNPTPSCTAGGIATILTAWERKYTTPSTTHKPMMKTASNGTKPHGSNELEEMPTVENGSSAEPDHSSQSEKNPTGGNRKSVGDILLEIARTATYFHTPDKVPYADVIVNGNRHTYAVRSRAFRMWLTGEYLEREDKGVGSQTLQDTFNTLEAIAICRGETREVHLRVAEYQGKHYVDLATPDWKAVEIDASGWRIISDPPIRFWRPESMLPLPIPVEGGSLEELKEMLNVDAGSWILIVTFLLFCFCPDKTYPVLVLSAHRGSGKTAAAEIIKGLIDPGKAALIKLQGDTHKLAVAATRRHLMVYDNVSHITPDQSDDLCRIATGFGFSTRTLHTTDEETTFELTRPQIITAIDALVTRDDLADRVLMAHLPEIPANKRLPQGKLNAKVEAARPRILGALLTALSQTLAELPHTNPESLPRMADYALFAIASEKALGLEKGEFTKTFDQSREQSRQVVIESSPVGEALVRLMENTPLGWKGTASQLLNELEKHTDEATHRSRYFPKASNSLSRQLNRLAPDLRALGIEVGYLREGKESIRFISLKVIKISSVSSASAIESLKSSLGKDLKADDIADDKPTIPVKADDILTCIIGTDGKQAISSANTDCLKTFSGKGFEELADDADDTDDIFTTYSNSPLIGSFQVGDRVTPSEPENARWGQEGKIEVIEVDEMTATIEWDIDGDKQMAKCFRTYWINDLKLVESPTNRGI